MGNESSRIMGYIGPSCREMKGLPARRRSIQDIPRDSLPIIAIDPGGVTGWSLLVIRRRYNEQDIFSHRLETILHHKILWEHGEINCRDSENEACYQLCRLFDNWPGAAIVVEHFILSPNRNEKSSDLLSPVRIAAKLDYHLWRSARRVLYQTPSQAKSTITDERLKLWNCYTPAGGQQHARDADRHALLLLRRAMASGPEGGGIRLVAWPHVYMPQSTEEGLNKLAMLKQKERF